MSGEDSIRRGEDAGLSNLRAVLTNTASGNNSDSATQVREAALEQFLNGSKEERMLHSLLAIRASVTGSDESNDDDVDDSACDFTHVAGYTAVTSEQIIFLAKDAANAAYDIAIDAACIDLHAVQQEPVVAVYIQITDPDAVDDEASPLEMTLEPNTSSTNDKDADSEDPQSVSQTLFDALSALVTLHPVDPNDDMMDMNTGGGGMNMADMVGMTGGSAGMGMGMGTTGMEQGNGGEWMGADGIMDDSDVDDMMVVRATANHINGNVGEHNDDGAEQDHHAAMLDRLDNMLEVPDDLVVADEGNYSDVVEGQFDDAEDDEDDAIL
jgi:hypothetical protein